MNVRLTKLFVLFGVWPLVVGCGPRTVTGKADKTYDKLTWISEAYMKATDELNRGPTKMDELKPHLTVRGDPAEIARSDNDNQEFVILWGVDYRQYERAQRPFPVIAYEQTGKNGLRYVLQVRFVSQLKDEELHQAAFPAGVKPPG